MPKMGVAGDRPRSQLSDILSRTTSPEAALRICAERKFATAGQIVYRRLSMKRILIITPDPEAARTLELAFELDGWEVAHSATVKGAHAGKTNLVLLDMVEGAHAFEKEIDKATFKGMRIMAIAPRGKREKAVKEGLPMTDLVLKRPYELTHLVKTAGELIGE